MTNTNVPEAAVETTVAPAAPAGVAGSEAPAPPAMALPGDLPGCHAMIQEMLQRLQESQRLANGLQHQIQQLLRRLYGRSKESLRPEELALFQEILDQLTPRAQEQEQEKTAATPAPQAPAATPEEKPRPAAIPGHGRTTLPAHLQRTVVTHTLPAEEQPCPTCGQARGIIGREVSEQIDFVPARITVLRHVRNKHACRRCERNGLNPQIVVAEKPLSPVEKGLAAPGLLAHVVVSKYADHLPLYRLENMFQRHGIALTRSTLCDFAAQAATAMEPLVEVMRAEVLQSRVIHTDDTPVRVQDKTLGQTREGRFWAYVGDKDHPYCVFTYSPDRSGSHPAEVLKNYSGYLQADAFAGYDQLYQAGDGRVHCRRIAPATEVACWAHARRKFFEAKDSDAARSVRALAFIRLLYDVEDAANAMEHCTEEQRLALRQQRAVGRLAEFKEWLESQQVGKSTAVLPKSPMGLAITYALNQWDALCVYTTRGFLALDNNIVENTLRRVGIGRKNWLFVGSDRGGRTAATHYSIMASCQRHGVNPWLYYKDVLTRISGHAKVRLPELLPDRWKPPPESGDP